MYKVTEFSEMTGLSKETLRYYAEVKLIEPAYIDPKNNYRYYDDGSYFLALLLVKLRSFGFTIQEILLGVRKGDKKTMIQWQEERVIPVPIEKVWELFLDKNIKRTMPKVEEHTLIEKTETEVGAKHQQTYREGKRMETYIVETLAYEDKPDRKHKQIAFVLGKAFEINLSFTLEKVDETHTRFIYAGHNKGVNFVGRAMLKLGSEKSNNKVVQEYMDRVEAESMK